MPDIILTTLNARYAHCAFGLRYLMANLGELKPRATILEFDINQRVVDVAERILAHEPRIVGFGVYIWNVSETAQLVADLKRLRPDLVVIIGGPKPTSHLRKCAGKPSITARCVAGRGPQQSSMRPHRRSTNSLCLTTFTPTRTLRTA